MSVTKKVSPKKRFATLRAHYKRAAAAAHEHIIFAARDEESWYFMLGVRPGGGGGFDGNRDEFRGGQYVGIVTATQNYPYEPPLVEMLTPTGVFPVRETKFCISIGQYHSRDYPAVLGMDGYVESIWSGLIGHESLGQGIGLVGGDVAAIRAAAAESVAYNARVNPLIVAIFGGAAGAKKD